MTHLNTHTEQPPPHPPPHTLPKYPHPQPHTHTHTHTLPHYTQLEADIASIEKSALRAGVAGAPQGGPREERIAVWASSNQSIENQKKKMSRLLVDLYVEVGWHLSYHPLFIIPPTCHNTHLPPTQTHSWLICLSLPASTVKGFARYVRNLTRNTREIRGSSLCQARCLIAT